jgi:FkbM family methyltransferase
MKKSARDFIKAMPLVGPICKITNRFFLKSKAPFLVPARQLRWRLLGERNLVVLQIGANDGLATDPIHDLLMQNPDWEAILVEPVPFLYERLKKNYLGRSKTRFLNVAVSEKDGNADFYYLDEDVKKNGLQIPEWYDQVGSFNPTHLSNCLGLEISKHIKSMVIQTVSFETLLRANEISKLDLLHIDTEGHDWIILKQLDLSKISPKIILFENKHLSKAETEEFFSVFKDKYTIINLGTDYLCQLKK